VADAHVLYADLSFRVMSAVFAVHNALGPGFTENIYEQALARELDDLGIPFEQQKPIEVLYKDGKVGDYRLDFLVDGKVILELKALAEMPSLFEVQVHSYLKATGLQLGILVNFGTKKVEYKRIVLKGRHESHE
jgi:GxxExxY protein